MNHPAADCKQRQELIDWCNEQRELYHAGELAEWKIRMLESLESNGVQWSWGPPPSNTHDEDSARRAMFARMNEDAEEAAT